jgi:hypothetical protein
MKDIKARMYVAHTHTKAGISQKHVAEDEFYQQTFLFVLLVSAKYKS